MFLLPFQVSAVELPRTVEEFLERQNQAQNTFVVSTPKNELEFVSRAILAQIKGTKIDGRTFKAIAMAESGLDPQAKNWNCRYGKISKSCKKEDRANAWSVDCGIMQLNFKGLHCPSWSYDLNKNIEKAVEKYHIEGLGAWVVYKNGMYKKYLALSDG